MKGCPLSCRWCHNPEGLSPEQETILQKRRVGDIEFSAGELAGKYYSVTDILDVLERDRIFFQQSSGGVTFSGGEPMMQAEFLLEALKTCRSEGYHTTVDTSGYSSAENFRNVIPFTDLFLFDIKHLDESKHIEYTGVSNTGILDNLRLILNNGSNVVIRIPVIPGKNDGLLNLSMTRNLLVDLKCKNLIKISLLPFHKTGKAKYGKLNLPYLMDETIQPSKERMRELKEFFSETGIKVKIGG
jgi:pyruvate formate lyase activating enzyme